MGEGYAGAGTDGWERAGRALREAGLPPGSLVGRRVLSTGPTCRAMNTGCSERSWAVWWPGCTG
ncbi:hypothetical protein [Streptomyces aureus]